MFKNSLFKPRACFEQIIRFKSNQFTEIENGTQKEMVKKVQIFIYEV